MNDIVLVAEHNGWRCLTHDGSMARFEKELLGHRAYVTVYFGDDTGLDEIHKLIDDEEAFLLRDGLPPSLRCAPSAQGST